MRILASSLLVVATLAAVATPAPAERVLGCCVTDSSCGLNLDEQIECLIDGGDFITAASGARCVVVESEGPDPFSSARCTCDGLGDLSGRELVNALHRAGQCRQLPKGRVCECPPPPSVPTPTPPPFPTFTVIATFPANPVGCCQFDGSPRTCRQTTLSDCKRPGNPTVFVQHANCTGEGRCLIIPVTPTSTPSVTSTSTPSATPTNTLSLRLLIQQMRPSRYRPQRHP